MIPIGAHLKVWRGAYWHHAIHVRGGWVIHYTGLTKNKHTAIIRYDRLEVFQGGGPVRIVEYARSFSADLIVHRAQSRIGENGYNLFGNNCEHFARWCVTGEQKSDQIQRLRAGGAGSGSGSALTAGAVGGVVAAGEAAGLAGGAGVMHGLAATGGAVGAGVAGGLVFLATAPAAATTIAMRHAYADDPMLPARERQARRAARDTTAVAAAGGTLGSLAMVSAAGIPGLSAAGITSGLAAIGSAVGGGMLAGVAVTVGAPAIFGWLLGRIAYRARQS
jgi:hypothetical protein